MLMLTKTMIAGSRASAAQARPLDANADDADADDDNNVCRFTGLGCTSQTSQSFKNN